MTARLRAVAAGSGSGEPEPHDRGASQTLKVELALRELILDGTLRAGERLSEPMLAERLGASRTPIRVALATLRNEGLLDLLPNGSSAVRAFDEAEVFASIEIRGTLEGLAARLAAERGGDAAVLASLDDNLLAADPIVGGVTPDGFRRYVELNARFHSGLVALSRSAALARQIERAVALPFASPSAFVMAQSMSPDAQLILTIAQDQHRSVVEAIRRREGARAEAIMREHARLASRNLAAALAGGRAIDLVPGAALIRRARSGARR